MSNSSDCVELVRAVARGKVNPTLATKLDSVWKITPENCRQQMRSWDASGWALLVGITFFVVLVIDMFYSDGRPKNITGFCSGAILLFSFSFLVVSCCRKNFDVSGAVMVIDSLAKILKIDAQDLVTMSDSRVEFYFKQILKYVGSTRRSIGDSLINTRRESGIQAEVSDERILHIATLITLRQMATADFDQVVKTIEEAGFKVGPLEQYFPPKSA